MPDRISAVRRRRWLTRDLINLGWDWLEDFDRHYAKWGMNYADEMVLGTLILDRGGRCRPKDLDLPIRMAPSTLTKSMGRLEEAGYITRESDSSDRRALWLVATPKGVEVLEELLPGLDDVVDRCFENLTKQEEKQLTSLLEKLGRS